MGVGWGADGVNLKLCVSLLKFVFRSSLPIACITWVMCVHEMQGVAERIWGLGSTGLGPSWKTWLDKFLYLSEP